MSAPILTLKPIRQLPLQLANQIAAGEVVERPASVIKELLENSLDAGATRIEIAIQHGGVREMSVRDNGSGIPVDELVLALSRHATSKIDSTDDLARIQSLGFRGEALASIASVSRLQLTSRTEDDEQGWQVNCENGKPLAPSETGHPAGSTVQVQDLFYNTPARRKFLRNERTEFRHIDTVVRRVALSHFATGIKLQHNGRTVYQLNPANTEMERQRRVAKLCGKAFMDHAVYLDFQARGLRLRGWLTQTDFSRSANDLQHFFVNGRMIRDRLITHAVHQVYQAQLLPGRFPGFVLQLEIDPDQVDVNVHPTKHEVRFREARLVHDFIYRSCQDALANRQGIPRVQQRELRGEHRESNQVYTRHTAPASRHIAESRSHWPALVPADTVSSPDDVNETGDHLLGHTIGLIHNRFLLAQNQTGMVMVDLNKATAQLCYEQLRDAFNATNIISQPMLVPVTVQVSEQQANVAEQQTSLLKQMGFDLDRIGPESVMVRMLPALLRSLVLETAIPDLLTTLQDDGPDSEQAQRVYRVLSEQINEDYSARTKEQLNPLLRQVESMADPTLWCSLSLSQIQALINPIEN